MRVFCLKRGDFVGATKGKNNKGGRKPTPATLLKKETARVSNQQIEMRKIIEVSLTSASIDIQNPPSSMSSAGKKEWRRIIALYQQLPNQILCDLDYQVLRTYCEAVANYDRASKIIKKVESECRKTGIAFRLEMVAAESKVLNQCSKEIRALTDQLCLSPVSRAAQGIIGAKQQQNQNKDPTSKYFAEDD